MCFELTPISRVQEMGGSSFQKKRSNNRKKSVTYAVCIFARVSSMMARTLAALAKVSGLAVRLGVARTRIIRLENRANPRVKQDFSVGKAEVGLEAAKMFRIFEGGPGFQELIQQGKLSVLLQEETSFTQSVSFVLAHFLNELGILPQLREAQIALQVAPEKKPFSLFNRRKEVG